MKRINIILLLTLMLTLVPTNVLASDVIKVFINGQQIQFTDQPVIQEGNTLVQFRPIFESLGFEVSYYEIGKRKTVKGNRNIDNLQILLDIGEKKASVGKDVVHLAVAPKIINGSTFVPLRFIAESSGAEVKWNSELRRVDIVTTDIQYTDGMDIGTNGLNYVGELKNGLPHGKGVLTSIDGTKYEGEFKNGFSEGQGTFSIKDGTKYVGEFKNGLPNGYGTYYDSTGKIIQQGNYADGELVKPDIQQVTNINELKNYLDANFGTLQTSIGSTSFTFVIYENTSILSTFDYWIQVKFDSTFFNDVKYSNKISADLRSTVKQELRDYQEKLGRSVIEEMPTKKIMGGFYDSWYKYPNLRVDLQTRKYFSWKNYDGSIIDGYEVTTPGAFQWDEYIDNEL